MYFPVVFPFHATGCFKSFPLKVQPVKMIGFRGYKRCGDSIVTLGISDNARTNIYRDSCKNKLTAKHRCDKAFVLDIWNTKFGCHENSVSSDTISTFKYTIGTFVEEPKFSNDLEMVCDQGIHFFLREDLAETYIEDVFSQEGNNVAFWKEDGSIICIFEDSKIEQFVFVNHLKFCRVNKFQVQ